MTRDDIAHYLETRAKHGFTVIQAVCLAEFDGITEPNREGHLPLHDGDPSRPNDAYFELVDWAIDYAAQLGLYVGLLPTWGDKISQSWGKGPVVFTPENAWDFGRFLGHRYQNAPIIWINGGDRKVDNETQAGIWRRLAHGLKNGDENAHLMTFHPQGQQSSSAVFHNEPWLDFNMIQSGHSRPAASNDVMISKDYARVPIKPCMDGEPCYENHPIDFHEKNGRFTTHDVRSAAYHALFAGAHGHTYGCHDVWQFFDAALHPPVTFANLPWRDALHLPAANQMVHAKNLLLSRPFLTRIPAPEIAAYATRDENNSYAFVYVPHGDSVTVPLGGLANGGTLRLWWFDPRTGAASDAGTVASASGRHTFTPLTSGPEDNDWVLVLDDAAANFSPPGVVEIL